MTAKERADAVMDFFRQHPTADQRDGIMFAIQAAEIDAKNAAIAEEREGCARLAENLAWKEPDRGLGPDKKMWKVAAEIRKRGEA